MTFRLDAKQALALGYQLVGDAAIGLVMMAMSPAASISAAGASIWASWSTFMGAGSADPSMRG